MITNQIEKVVTRKGDVVKIFIGAELEISHKLVRKSRDKEPLGFLEKYSSYLQYKYWDIQKLENQMTVKVVGVRTISDGSSYYVDEMKVFDKYVSDKGILVVSGLYNKPFYINRMCIL